MPRFDFGKKFERQADRLLDKYPRLGDDLEILQQSLQSNPQQGSPLGKGCYKARLAFSDKKAGQSGGGRVTTYVKLRDDLIVLAIYDISEEATMCQEVMLRLLKEEGLS